MVADLVRVVFNAALVLVALRCAFEDDVDMVLASRCVVLVRAVVLRCVVLLIRPEPFLWVDALALWV